MIREVWGLFFSPCGNVEKLIRAMAGAAGETLGVPVRFGDMTLPTGRTDRALGPEALAFVGTPVYAGRVPNKLAPYIAAHIRGTGPAVPVVCFGNRSFDNALAELADILGKNGFTVTAAAAAVGEHAFTRALAADRPTAADLAQAADFARAAAERLREGEIPALAPGAIPGDPAAPYYTPLGRDGRPAAFLRAVPVLDEKECIRCGVCASVCPMGSVDRLDPGRMNGICIKCHACVRKCPMQARSFDDPAFLSHRAMLEENYARPAEPLYIL